MSDQFQHFFDAAPLGLPGWEHSRVEFRSADTLGGRAQLIGLRSAGSQLITIIEVGGSPDPSKLVEAMHDFVHPKQWPEPPPRPEGRPVTDVLSYLWSIFDRVAASRPLSREDAHDD